jgi:hypothetical protein
VVYQLLYYICVFNTSTLSHTVYPSVVTFASKFDCGLDPLGGVVTADRSVWIEEEQSQRYGSRGQYVDIEGAAAIFG